MHLPQVEPKILTELRDLKQWVCWKLINGKKKVPVSPHGGETSTVQAAEKTWATYDQAYTEAVQCHHGTGYSGIGFVFTYGDPYVGVDLDKCRDAKTGEIEEWAQKIIKTLNTYTEISQSGTGVHMLAKGNHMVKGHNVGQIEMYSHKRYFIFTGKLLHGAVDKIEDRNEALDALEAEHFQKTEQKINANGIDFDISPKARCPDNKLKALLENSSDFKKTWLHQRKDMTDESASAYDMSIACHFVRAEWTPVEVAAGIIHHRSIWYTGKEFEKALRIDYIRVTYENAINFVERGIDSETASLNDAIRDGGDDAMNELGRKLNVSVTEVIQRGGSPSQFYMTCNGSPVKLGTMDDVFRQGKVRSAICEVTGKPIKMFTAPKWNKVVELLCALAVREELAGSGSVDEMKDLIMDYAESRNASGVEWESAFLSSGPFRRDGKLHIHRPEFRKYMGLNADYRLKPAELSFRLREVGFEQKNVSTRDSGTGKVVTKSYWVMEE